MTYADMCRQAEDARYGALILSRPDGERLQVRSLPEFQITNLIRRLPHGEEVKTCYTQAETLRAVRLWYEGGSRS